MGRVRCITEMGMGVDVHGRDATKAAKRAVSDAIRHSSLGFVRMLGKTPHDMFVDVTIGVPDPGAVESVGNISTLRGGRRPRGRQTPDVICQTRTPAAPGAVATVSKRTRAFFVD